MTPVEKVKARTTAEIEVLMQQIAVMQAYLAGKKIEYRTRRTSGRWLDADPVRDMWDWDDLQYRVKSEEE